MSRPESFSQQFAESPNIPPAVSNVEDTVMYGQEIIPPTTDIAVPVGDLPEDMQSIAKNNIRYRITPEQYAIVDPATREIKKVYEMARIGEGAVVVINRLTAEGRVETLLHWEERLMVNDQGQVELKKVLACRRGHKDAQDENLLATAYREAKEESGRDPYEMVDLGGGALNLSISPDKGRIFEAHVANEEDLIDSPEKDPGIEPGEVWVLLDDAFEMQFDDLLTEVAIKRSYASHRRMEERLILKEDSEREALIRDARRTWNPHPEGTAPLIKHPHTDIEDPPETKIVSLIPEKPNKEAA